MPRLLREFALELSSIIFMLGVIMTFLVVMKFAFEPSLPFFLKDVLNAIGNWIVWMVVVGPVLLIGAGWYFFDGISKRREFAKLIDTDSKAVFVRNLDRLEELAYYLTENHREMFYKKKEDLKVK